MIWLFASARVAVGAASLPRLRLVRGGLAADAGARGRAPGLPAALDGLRIAHLSDFHLGPRSRGRIATGARSPGWRSAQPGPRLRHGRPRLAPAGEPLLRELLGRLGRPYVVLGQPRRGGHAGPVLARPPSSTTSGARGAAAGRRRDGRAARAARPARRRRPACLPAQEGASPWQLADPTADLRILLCHFPGIVGARCPRERSTSCWPGTCTPASSCCPYPGGRRHARASAAREFVAGSTPTPAA